MNKVKCIRMYRFRVTGNCGSRKSFTGPAIIRPECVWRTQKRNKPQALGGRDNVLFRFLSLILETK